MSNVDEAIDTFTKILELDPEYKEALNLLAYRYSNKGDVSKAIELLKRYQALSPGDPNPFDSMGDIYRDHGMFDEAISCYEMAHSVKPDWVTGASSLASVYFLEEDYVKALQWTDSAIVRSRILGVFESVGRGIGPIERRAHYLLWLGRLNDAQSSLKKSLALQPKSDQASSILKPWLAFERGRLSEARSLLRMSFSSLGASRTWRWLSLFCTGMIDAKERHLDSLRCRLLTMDTIRAEAKAAVSDRQNGKLILDSYDRASSILRSELFIAEGKPVEAVDTARERSPHELASRPVLYWLGPGHSTPGFPPIPVMTDILPRAYLSAGLIDSAIVAYERAVDPKIDPTCPIFPRYHYRLALLYEQKGLKDKAIAEYEKFLRIWGKADPIYKEPADARARLARLKGGKGRTVWWISDPSAPETGASG